MRPAKEPPRRGFQSRSDARAPFYLTMHLLTYGHLFLFFPTNRDTQLQLRLARSLWYVRRWGRGRGGRKAEVKMEMFLKRR